MTRVTNTPSLQPSSPERAGLRRTAGRAWPLQPSSAGFSTILTSPSGDTPPVANQHDLYTALPHTVRDRMMER